MNNNFEKYLGIANHDIQIANTSQELKSYVASILYENDKKVEEINRLNNIINELEKYLKENIKLTKTAVHFEILDDYDTRKYKRDIALFEMVLDKLKELKENKK